MNDDERLIFIIFLKYFVKLNPNHQKTIIKALEELGK